MLHVYFHFLTSRIVSSTKNDFISCYRDKVVALNRRGDKTRTCDLYVPNVARYQLRHTPIFEAQNYNFFLNHKNFKRHIRMSFGRK